jgi:hypothetical protein
MHCQPGGLPSVSRPDGRRARRAKTALLILLVIITGCVSPAPRFSADELALGVEIDVSDPNGAIEDAWVFLPPETEPFLEHHPALAEGRVVVLDEVDVPPGSDLSGSFDAVVLYRTGPFCGIAPSVAATVVGNSLRVDVRSIETGTCDALEYDEALGLRLSEQGRDLQVIANQCRADAPPMDGSEGPLCPDDSLP